MHAATLQELSQGLLCSAWPPERRSSSDERGSRNVSPWPGHVRLVAAGRWLDGSSAPPALAGAGAWGDDAYLRPSPLAQRVPFTWAP